MSETPLSPYSPYSATCTATAANVPTSGYAVTRVSDGIAVATTALLGSGTSGTYDGIALATGVAGFQIQVQRYGYVDPTYVSWLSTGSVEVCVVDSNGKPQRASAASGTAIGFVDKLGGIVLALPLGSLAYTTVYYQTVQELGTDKTQAAKLNFASDLLAANETGKTTVTTGWARQFMLSGMF